MLTVIVFIAILGLLVLVHELGHFVIARRNGVKVDEFGFGLPPRLVGMYKGDDGKWKIVGRKVHSASKTIYSINWLPLGGFVRMKGEEDAASEGASDPDSFAAKSVGARFRIISAGVIMNVILAAVLLSISLAIGSPQFINEEVPTAANIRDIKVRVLEILPESPAEQAGLQVGDALLAINGERMAAITELQAFVGERGEQELTFLIERDREEFEQQITPVVLEGLEQPGIGVAMVATGTVSYPWYTAWMYGIWETLKMIWGVLAGFFVVIKNLLVSQKLVGEVYGPVGIATLVGDAIGLGWLYVVQFSAVLSVILAVVNYLPIPALDGGHALFLLIEKVRGKKVDPAVQQKVTNIGFMALMGLILIVTIRDISRFSGGFMNWWTTLF